MSFLFDGLTYYQTGICVAFAFLGSLLGVGVALVWPGNVKGLELVQLTGGCVFGFAAVAVIVVRLFIAFA